MQIKNLFILIILVILIILIISKLFQTEMESKRTFSKTDILLRNCT